MTLEDKRVVLLGGTAGIGLATAQAAADAGAQVVVVSSNPDNVAKALTLLPASAQGEIADLTTESEIEKLFTKVSAFDHLVYTAGESLSLFPLQDTEVAAAQRFFQIRYWGAYTSVKYAVPHINTGGSIVLSSGGAVQRPMPGWTVAASILGAIEALCRALAVELAPIRVNAVRPGLVRTDLWREFPAEVREELFRTHGGTLPVGRVGEAADLARSYLHLMEQDYATGSILTVDGGGVLV
ncbi:SDR family oxidoreductase [Nocardia macrotermitis]|uniref:3-alpha-hydroxycholanate dehydrogenase (NADP(+)) n=1 Tax=Nocardia macrotermitis TaxID=2585198 RepID=A0A7K0D4I7_9NOCA|nr:SDR family oxidoreductase [Nocardia macrotermitis]MQY20656.1 3-alpha-hydroxycholanate dehydrogenase (NADP(+)) [Nocardia macrotermitis]